MATVKLNPSEWYADQGEELEELFRVYGLRHHADDPEMGVTDEGLYQCWLDLFSDYPYMEDSYYLDSVNAWLARHGVQLKAVALDQEMDDDGWCWRFVEHDWTKETK